MLNCNIVFLVLFTTELSETEEPLKERKGLKDPKEKLSNNHNKSKWNDLFILYLTNNIYLFIYYVIFF